MFSVTYIREAVSVEYRCVKELTKSKRLEHPATKPPRPLSLAAILDAPDGALGFAHVPAILKSLEHCPDCNRHAQLLRRVDAESQAGKRGTDSRCIRRCESTSGAWVALPEGLDLRIHEMCSQPTQEAEKQAVEK